MSALLPSVPPALARISPPLSVRPTTAAPAASPNRTQTLRSCQSYRRVRSSAPITRTLRSRSFARARATSRPSRNPRTTAPPEIVGGNVAHTQAVLHEGRGVGDVDLGRVRRDDDLVDVPRPEARVLHRHFARGHGHADGGLIVRRHTTALDPGPLGDPLVRGVDVFRPLVVGHDAARHVRAEAEKADRLSAHEDSLRGSAPDRINIPAPRTR